MAKNPTKVSASPIQRAITGQSCFLVGLLSVDIPAFFMLHGLNATTGIEVPVRKNGTADKA
jgi:hypothetical protein